MASKDSTGGATPATGKADRPMTGVGGVRSSDDPVLDLWWSGQNMEERRDATCSAEVKSNEGRGDGPRGLPAPDKVRQLQIILYRKAKFACRQRNPESRMRENRPSGLMMGGKQTVIATRPFNPPLPAYSTQSDRKTLDSRASCSRSGGHSPFRAGEYFPLAVMSHIEHI